MYGVAASLRSDPAEQLQQTLVNHDGELQQREEEAAAPQTSSSPITMMTYSVLAYSRLLAAYSPIQFKVLMA